MKSSYFSLQCWTLSYRYTRNAKPSTVKLRFRCQNILFFYFSVFVIIILNWNVYQKQPTLKNEELHFYALVQCQDVSTAIVSEQWCVFGLFLFASLVFPIEIHLLCFRNTQRLTLCQRAVEHCQCNEFHPIDVEMLSYNKNTNAKSFNVITTSQQYSFHIWES